MSAAPTIWIVSELYYPEETSTGRLLTQTAEGLAERLGDGWRVRVVCSQPTYESRGVRAPARERRAGVDIERAPATTLRREVLLYRLINVLTITGSLAWRAFRGVRRGDVVLCVTNPPLLPFAVVAACRLRGARCVLVVQDVYPEAMIAARMASPSSLPTRIMRAASRWVYRAMDRIVVLGRDMADVVARKLDGARDQIVLIPNWGDLDVVSPQPREGNPILKELGIADTQLVVQYAGNMGLTHDLESLAEAADQLREYPVRWLFIGSGAKRGWLQREVERRGLSSVTVTGYRPRSELETGLAACDLSIISFMPGMAGVSVPSRMYNVMAAGRAIVAVADPESEIAQVLEEEEIGWVVPPGHPEALVELLKSLVAQREEVRVRGARAREVVMSKYALEHSLVLYESLVRELGGDPSRATEPAVAMAGRGASG